MSGFFGSNDTTLKWGGYFKQAISNVETTFDSFLDQPNQQQSTNKDTETETYIDPISGAITTIERPKSAAMNAPSTNQTSARSSLDLSSRLAAAMADKPKHPKSSRKKVKEKTEEIDMTDEKVEAKEMQKENDTTAEKEDDATVEEAKVKEEENEKEAIEVEKEDKEEPEAVPEEVLTDDNTKASPKKVESEEPLSDNDTNVNEIHEIISKTETIEGDENSTQDPVPKLENEEKLEQQNTKVNNTNVTANDDKDRILEQRENQLLQAMENIAELHDQMQKLQENAEKNEAELKSTISELDTKIKKLEEETVQAGSSANLQKSVKRLESVNEDLKKQISAKDEKIQGLLQEGEKLSKTEFKHTTTIKKLRLEKTEADKNISELTKRLEKANADLSEATEKGSKQTESEKKLQESVKLLTDLTEKQTKHINKLESEKIARQKKLVETETALKNALDSIEDERAKAKLEAEQSSAAALEKEMMANDRLHKELTKVKQDAEFTENKLKKEIRKLQISLQTVEEQAGIREDNLRQELKELQLRLQQFENKMEDVNVSVDEATAPLLRQIEELQTQHALAIKNRDQAEQSIILRMQTAEMERKRALEKDEKLQNDIKFLNEQLNQSKTEIEDLRNRFTILNAQVEADAVTKNELEAQIRKLTKEKEELNEKEAKDQEALKKQYQRLMKEKLNEERTQFEIKLKAVSATPSPVLNQEHSEENSDFIVNNLKSIHTGTPSVSSRSSFDSNSTSVIGSSILTDKHQANIRRLENQISFYQTQLQNSNQSRDELSEEVLAITQEIEQLREQMKTKNELEQQYQQLNKRYQTLLELLGERTEEVEELKADLQDVKDMYKSQIVELVQKIDQLSGKK